MKQNRTKRNLGALIALSFAICGATGARAATIENFEGSLGGNEALQGDAGIVLGGYSGINDPNGGGNGQLLLTTINTSSANTADSQAGYHSEFSGKNATAPGTFFGNGASFTPTDSGTPGTEGSGYRITGLSLTAGQTLSFDWDFLTNESNDPEFGHRDFAFYTLSTSTPSGDVVLKDAFSSAQNPGAGQFSIQNGYTTTTIPISTTGTYVLTLGVMDAGNAGTDDAPSALLVDNIQTNAAVPEPSTLGLLGLGALGFAAVRRRIRK